MQERSLGCVTRAVHQPLSAAGKGLWARHRGAHQRDVSTMRVVSGVGVRGVGTGGGMKSAVRGYSKAKVAAKGTYGSTWYSEMKWQAGYVQHAGRRAVGRAAAGN